ncbi:MAG: hypothetical protein KGQ51_00495 [Planctomycetes bacterium]|jgi:hypothetical protein|nr:hypothetical protein [Planctomycetota bacterium]
MREACHLDTVGRDSDGARRSDEIQLTREPKMLEMLLESPVTIGAIGAIVAIATFYAWMQTGIKQLLPTSIAVAAATIMLVILSLMIDTDQEILRRYVYETASELEANQYQKVIAKIHPRAADSLQDARNRLPDIQFTAARIKTIHEISVTRHRTGSHATITMNVYIEASYNAQQGQAPRWVQLTLEQTDGRWLMVDFQQREPHYQLLNQEGQARLNRFNGW